MTVAAGAVEADVKIRAPGLDWMCLFLLAGVWFASVGLDVAMGAPAFTWRLVFACLLAAEGLWIRTFGVDLTQESANIRGLRRSTVPWREVQAVVCRSQLGTGRVSLILESGKRLTLRAPTSSLGFGGARYERDFHRIGQWWLAHRGMSWRPVRPEAPQLPAQGPASSTMTGT